MNTDFEAFAMSSRRNCYWYNTAIVNNLINVTQILHFVENQNTVKIFNCEYHI